jgi:large repetitive protein
MACTGTHTVTQEDLDAGHWANTACVDDGAGGAAEVCDGEDVPGDQNPALTLDKTVTETSYDAMGDILHYSYKLTNSGNVTLIAPFSVDDYQTTVTCPATPTSLAPLAYIDCSATYVIDQADLDAGFVTNVAMGHGYFGEDPVDSKEDSVTVNADQTPELTLDKTDDLNPAKYTTVGQVVKYTLTAKNNGNVTLHNVTVVDNPALDNFSCTPAIPVASLAPGATIVCTGTHAITQGDLDAGSFADTATADSDETAPVEAPDTVYAAQNPALTMTKTATPITYSKVGDKITYSYLVTNSGNVTLMGPFKVVDNKATVTCPATPSLAPGASITCTASYTIISTDLCAGKVTNKATAAGGGATSNQATATVNAVQTKALSLTKTAAPTTYSQVGDKIAYSYVIKNTGNVTLTGPFSIADNKTTVTCTQPADGALSPNETMTCSASYTIAAADMTAGKVTNKATAAGGGAISNQATATVTASQCKALSLTKTAAPTTYSQVGDKITYSYVIKNTGNVTLGGPFTVADDKATVTCPTTASLAPDASITCSASYTITAADMTAGKVTNTATAAGGGAISNQATATVTATQCKALSLTKTAAPTTYSQVGDVISYSYEVKNTGCVALSGPFTVADDKATVTCPATASLAPGASITCTASYSITQADLDAGSVTSTATASGGGVTSSTATETVYFGNPTAVTLSDLKATALSTGEQLMMLLRGWLQR